MESDYEVQHQPGRENTVDDVLSRLQSDHVDERFQHENISKRLVVFVDGPFSVSTVSSIEGDAPCRPTIDDFITERHEDASRWILLNQIDDNDSPYVIVEKVVLSRNSRLDGAVKYFIPTSIRQAEMYYAHDPTLAERTVGSGIYDTI